MKSFSWEKFPALFLFASLLSGALCSIGIVYPVLFAFTHKKRSFIIGYIFLSLFTSLLFIANKNNSLGSKELVTAYITPKNLKKSNGKLYLSAHIPYLKTDSLKELENISCIIPLEKKDRPVFNQDFIVKGTLKASSFGYFLQPKVWEKVPSTYSLTEKRYGWKKSAKELIKRKTSDQDVRAYFTALVTSNISDAFLKERFKAAGVLHTLAISGFHFSWIIFIFSIPLSLLFPKKWSLLLLLVCAWGYFFFLGPSASISRAFLAISIYLISILISAVPLPLNALGFAGILSMLIDPYSIFDIAFSLSYLATFAILTLHSLIASLTNTLCPKRCPKTLLLMPFFHKIAYFILRTLLLGGILSTCIQIILLPIFFIYFPFLPLWGFFYNIYFPLSMIPTLILLLLSFIFPSLWRINEIYSKPFLESVLYGNGFAFLLVKLPYIHPQILSLATCLLIFFCLRQEQKHTEKRLLLQDEFILT